ncbi:MAG TPA: hypothetical protein VFK40_02945 [Nitrososphaeraceae archaeon]|nr:hypothetical protein [Nitrososphaeraceae archaeon]
MSAIPTEIELKTLNQKLKKGLTDLANNLKINIAMPRCADLYLSIIDNSSINEPDPNEIAALFEEYFIRQKHFIFQFKQNQQGYLDENIERGFRCTGTPPGIEGSDNHDSSDCCLPCSCVTLSGNRRMLERPPLDPIFKISRLFFADLIWLFFMERMGTFNILGALLDDFATNGKYPFDIYDVSSIILNTWVEHAMMGICSRIRDRESAYIRCLGWKQPSLPRKTDPNKIITNIEMNKLIINFISLVLEWFRVRQVQEAIQGIASSTAPSGASLVAISESIRLIKIASKSFDYGRNMVITLNGIVEVIATLAILHRVRDKIGVPQSFTKLEDIIPVAIEKLGLSKNVGKSQVNTYHAHHEAAQDLRDILLDLEVLNFTDFNELRVWLYLTETKFEGFRKAYYDLTNIDLAKPEYRLEGTLRIEQQV